MKKAWLCLVAGLWVTATYAEKKESEENTKKDFIERMAEGQSVYQAATGKKGRKDYLQVNLLLHAGYDALFQDGLQQGKFNFREIRMEAKGNLNSWLSYHYRQRLNMSNDGSDGFDNLPASLDVAGIGVKFNDRWSVFGGKQCVAYGGIEFDVNLIDIYEYSDMVQNMSNYQSGVTVAYQATPSQQLQFQVVNSRIHSLERTYGKNLEDAKMPLLYTLNWNGTFKEVFKTRWSASVMNQAKGNRMYYLAFGQGLDLGKVDGFFDVMYSSEDIDRKGILTQFIGQVNEHNVNKARYLSLVTRWNYRFRPKWSVFAKGMYETASIGKEMMMDDGSVLGKGKYRTSLGYFTGLEFYPMETNLHFYLAYVGRSYLFEDRAKSFGVEDYSTNRVSVGFIYKLPVF